MNKPIFIIIGALIILVLIFIWVYLLFFGTPKTVTEVFTDFGGSSENVINQDNDFNLASTSDNPTINTERKNLRQLTTRSVAGFSEIDEPATGSLPSLYYVEMGTGHVYSIQLETGEEKRISGTTVAGANIATISPKGDYVVMGSRNNTKTLPLTIGKIGTSTSDLQIEEFSSSAEQFKISGDGKELLYATRESTGLAGHVYNFTKKSDKVLFNLPFHEANIQWGSQSSETHYLYPKAAYALEGYLYQVTNGKVSRLPVDGFGFSGLATKNKIAYSTFDGSSLKNFIYNRTDNTIKSTPIRILPEKCVIYEKTSNIVCAFEETNDLPIEFPDAWYQGDIKFKDSIWLISGTDSKLEFLIDTFKETSREIDATDLKSGSSDRAVYFINKNDNTLWMYEF